MEADIGLINNLMILVAGTPGTGKTRFANYLSDRLKLVLICKDKLKEITWDHLHYDTKTRTEGQKYGSLAYSLSFHFCEALMMTNQAFIFESNFNNQCTDMLKSMTERYGYKVITVMLSGDIKVIHQRFIQRDVSVERHPGLVSNGFFNDLNYFERATEPCRSFSFGDAIIKVDSTDFTNVSYGKITEMILDEYEKLKQGQ